MIIKNTYIFIVLLLLCACPSKIVSKNEDYTSKIHNYLEGKNVSHKELLNAITSLADAKDQKAAPVMINLLEQSDDVAIGNALVIALGDLEAKEAMPAIIDFAERKPPIIRRQAIIAAKRIASQLAAEWLLVMAYGHHDSLVREEAIAALKEVEKKLGFSGN